jgi:O-antigen ligase
MSEALLGLLLVVPWLTPFAGGPSPSVQPWLLTMACGTVLWLHRARLSPELVLRGWLVAAALNALAGLLQYIGWSASMAPWLVPTSPGEAFGNLRQRNQFATLTNMGLAALLWLAIRQGAKGTTQKLAFALVAALLAAANAASSSRTGMAQIVVLAALIWIWGLWRQAEMRRLFLTALISYGAATIILPTLIGMDATQRGLLWRLQQGDHACNSRIALWNNVLQLIAARPWTGWGWGELDYAHFITAYPGDRFCQILDNAHNLPLHLAVELGLPLTLLLLSFVARWFWRQRPWRESEAIKQAAWAILALIAVHSLLEYPLWYGHFQIAVALSLFLLGRKRDAPPSTVAQLRILDRTAATVVLLAVGFTAWDYWRVSQLYLLPEQRSSAYRENTLEKVRDSVLFRDQVDFAEYTLATLTRENATQLHSMGRELLHYSPEPRVVEKLIESTLMLGQDEEARFYQARYRAAYPEDYARWSAAHRVAPMLNN